MRDQIKDRAGERYGKLVALAPDPNNARRWLCQCDCGTIASILTTSMQSGNTRSCGCIRGDTNPKERHGLANHPDYKVWVGMKQRCTNPKNDRYRNYGGRGIKVYKPWLRSFRKFIEDMGPRPSPKHSLERLDNDGNYEPSNCIWATADVQRKNSRAAPLIMLTHNGKTQCLAAWATEAGMSPDRFAFRLRSGWSFEDALTLPAWHRPSSKLETPLLAPT